MVDEHAESGRTDQYAGDGEEPAESDVQPPQRGRAAALAADGEHGKEHQQDE